LARNQSEGGISNASGTHSVRVNAQGLSCSCCKLSPVKIPSPQLVATTTTWVSQDGACPNVVKDQTHVVFRGREGKGGSDEFWV